MQLDFDLALRFEKLANQLEALRLDDYLCFCQNWKRRLLHDFCSGIARGVGFSIGFTLLGAMILYLIKNAALENLPGIGRFLAEVVRIVERNL